MLNEWKRAWKEAVENFWRELKAEDDASGPGTRLGAMRREVAAAAGEVQRLGAELERARRALAAERGEEETCRRREALAREIGDAETARLAAEFAARHAERATVLARKIEVLEAERALSLRDLQEMKAALEQRSMAAGPAAAGAPAAPGPPDDATEDLFRRLEREARERSAEDRLQELKRRMR